MSKVKNQVNYVLMNGETQVSAPMSEQEARSKAEDLKKMGIYPNVEVVPTDQEKIVRPKIDVEPEVVEDVGCVGGGCTL